MPATPLLTHSPRGNPSALRQSLVFLSIAGVFGHAMAAGIPTLQEVVVTGSQQNLTGTADTASEGTITAKQLAQRPLLRPAELLEAVPGLIVTQHSGDGKANQYFLRGFNLDHGTDFSSFVNGVPVNNVTHAHGQGYMDLNFLIPELVGGMRYRKGVYAAEDGDRAITGSARIDYARSLSAPFLDVTLGRNGYVRSLIAGGSKLDDKEVVGAVEWMGNNGPWEQPEHFRKRNGVLSLASGSGSDGYVLTAMAYEAKWTATEHVPERAIDTGEIGRYGTLAPADGGKTHRYSVSGQWATPNGTGVDRASLFATDYGLNLFSSPSGNLDGQHEQADQRLIWGGELARSATVSTAGVETDVALGTQFRQDRIEKIGLYRTVARQRTSTVREDRVIENNLSLYASATTRWLPWLRTQAGVRWDKVWAEVTPLGGNFNMGNGGSTRAHQASPKLGLVLGPFDTTEVYLNWGQGFHSNDARGATSHVNAMDGSAIVPVPLLVKATGSEIGVRTQPLAGWFSSLTLWQMDLESELIFVGDEGVTEPHGSSRRHGLEWSNYYANGRGLILDSDLAISQARLKEASNGGTHVPNAVPVTASLAATLDEGGTWFGGLRLRYLGAYPLDETGTEKSTAFWTTNLKLGYRVTRSVQLSLDVLNVFDKKANDIEYWGASCTTSEGSGCNSGSGIDGRMIHPLEPRTLRFGIRITL